MCNLTMHQRAAAACAALNSAEIEAFTAWHADQPDLVHLWTGIQTACDEELADCQAAIAAGVP